MTLPSTEKLKFNKIDTSVYKTKGKQQKFRTVDTIKWCEPEELYLVQLVQK